MYKSQGHVEYLSPGWNLVYKEPLHGSVPSFLSHIQELCQGRKFMSPGYHKTCYILSFMCKREAVQVITDTWLQYVSLCIKAHHKIILVCITHVKVHAGLGVPISLLQLLDQVPAQHTLSL